MERFSGGADNSYLTTDVDYAKKHTRPRKNRTRKNDRPGTYRENESREF